MRRFEYHVGRTHRFWEIGVDGDCVSTRGGAIGQRRGSRRIKRYSSPQRADRAAAKQISSRRAKGYVELELEPAESAARHASLEARLHADPSDRATWAVYGDFLASAGDSLGERIILALELEREEGIQAARLATHIRELDARERPSWYGPHLESLVARRDFASFATLTPDAFGFIRTARVHAPSDDVPAAEFVAALVSSPAARFLRRLELRPAGTRGKHWMRSTLERFAEFEPMLSLLQFEVGPRWAHPGAYQELGPLGPVLAASPHLELLRARGHGVQLGALEHPHLHEVEITTTGTELGAVMHDVHLPACARLHVGTDRWPALDWRGEGPLLSGRGVPKLRDLGVLGLNEHGNHVLEALVNSRLLAQLERLSLAYGNLDLTRAGWILAAADRFHHLDTLDLSHNLIPGRTCHSLAAAIPGVWLNPQESASYWEEYASVVDFDADR